MMTYFEKFIEVLTKRAVDLATSKYRIGELLGENVEINELIPAFHNFDIDSMNFNIEFRDYRHVYTGNINIPYDWVKTEEVYDKTRIDLLSKHKSTVERLEKEREEQSRELKENKERKERAEYERLKKKFGD